MRDGTGAAGKESVKVSFVKSPEGCVGGRSLQRIWSSLQIIVIKIIINIIITNYISLSAMPEIRATAFWLFTTLHLGFRGACAYEIVRRQNIAKYVSVPDPGQYSESTHAHNKNCFFSSVIHLNSNSD